MEKIYKKKIAETRARVPRARYAAISSWPRVQYGCTPQDGAMPAGKNISVACRVHAMPMTIYF
jgi:hypothetical protein